MASLINKVIRVYTAPARFVINKSLDIAEKSLSFGEEIARFSGDIKALQADISLFAEDVYQTVANELSRLPVSITDEELHEEIDASFKKARMLLTSAAAEFAKGALLLSVPNKSGKPRNNNSGNVIEGQFTRYKSDR